MKTKALIYCRVSSKRQVEEGNGLSSQEKICTDFAKELGVEVDKIFKEEGMSGGILERKSLKEMLQYIDNNKNQNFVAIFEDLNRISRDMEVHIFLKKEFERRGVQLICTNFQFEDTPEGIFRENINVSVAQYEREKNKERVNKRMKSRLEQGFWCFALPIGLKYSSNKKGGKKVMFDNSKAKIIKKGLEDFSNDLIVTPLDFILYLNKNGINYGKFKYGSIQKGDRIMNMIGNILYTGYLEYEKWNIPKIKAQHKPLISLETHEKILKKIEMFRKRRNKKNIQKIENLEEKIEEITNRKDIREDFPLRGFLFFEYYDTLQKNILKSFGVVVGVSEKSKNIHIIFYLKQIIQAIVL